MTAHLLIRPGTQATRPVQEPVEPAKSRGAPWEPRPSCVVGQFLPPHISVGKGGCILPVGLGHVHKQGLRKTLMEINGHQQISNPQQPKPFSRKVCSLSLHTTRKVIVPMMPWAHSWPKSLQPNSRERATSQVGHWGPSLRQSDLRGVRRWWRWNPPLPQQGPFPALSPVRTPAPPAPGNRPPAQPLRTPSAFEEQPFLLASDWLQ